MHLEADRWPRNVLGYPVWTYASEYCLPRFWWRNNAVELGARIVLQTRARLELHPKHQIFTVSCLDVGREGAGEGYGAGKEGGVGRWVVRVFSVLSDTARFTFYFGVLFFRALTFCEVQRCAPCACHLQASSMANLLQSSEDISVCL